MTLTVPRLRSFFRLPYLPIWLTPLILFAPIIFTGQAIFYGTTALQFHPWRVLAMDALAAGDLPLWNSLSGMGAPLLANYQTAFFYPSNWMYFIFGAIGGDAAIAWLQAPLVVLHLIIAGVGMVRLVRALGWGELAQTVGGLAFGMSGYLVARSHFASIVTSAAWLPWILWASYLLVRDGKRHIPKLAALIALQLLAGHAQISWYSLLLMGAWVLFWSGKTETRSSIFDLGSATRAIVQTLTATLFAAALAAIQLFPTAELLRQSQRAAGADYEFAVNYSLWPVRLLGYIMPGVVGSPANGDFWGSGNYWEDALYIGLIPFLLALAALFSRRKSDPAPPAPRALRHFSLAVIIISITLALGKNTPIFPYLFRNIPTFDMFRSPTRYTLWATIALALLAALGAQRWGVLITKKSIVRTNLAIAGSAAVGIPLLIAPLILGDIGQIFIRPILIMSVVAISFALLIKFNNATPQWRWTVAAVIAIDLLVATWGLNPGIPLDFYTTSEPAPAALADGRVYIAPNDVYDLTFVDYFGFESFAADRSALRASRLPNINLLDAIPSANNFEPLLIGRYVNWMDEVDRTTDPAMLSLMNVTLIGTRTPDGVAFNPVAGAARLRWYNCAARAGDAEQAWRMTVLDAPLSTPAPAVILEGYTTNAQWVCAGDPTGDASLSLISETPNELRLRVDAKNSGWLFVADTWYPGWVATVNGQPAKLYRANYLFRGVAVPAGVSEIVMVYRPVSLYVGAVVSALAWGGWVWGRRKMTGDAVEQVTIGAC